MTPHDKTTAELAEVVVNGDDDWITQMQVRLTMLNVNVVSNNSRTVSKEYS